MGLCSYDLYSLYSYDRYGDGLYIYGLYSYDRNSHGLYSYGQSQSQLSSLCLCSIAFGLHSLPPTAHVLEPVALPPMAHGLWLMAYMNNYGLWPYALQKTNAWLSQLSRSPNRLRCARSFHLGGGL